MPRGVGIQVSKKRRGNPSFGRPLPPSQRIQDSSFDKIVARLELQPDQYAASAELRSWVERNATKKFVPESVLELYQIDLGARLENE